MRNQVLSCYVRLMHEDDVPQVSDLDRQVFPTMRPYINYHNELQNKLAHYVVACSHESVVEERVIGKEPKSGFSWLGGIFGRCDHEPKDVVMVKQYIFGFAGLWMMADEAHIINVAVREQHRRLGLGELLLISMTDMAIQLKARHIVLEARVSNQIAQNLYARYGFKAVGVRKGYYTDNHEDAVMMITEDVTTEGYHANLWHLKQAHATKWGVESYEIRRV